MANKYKTIFQNNLLSIREELGYTQKQMAQKLKVDEKTIRNYEYFETNFPLESAIFLSKEYGYTLDWIYCNFPTPKYLSAKNKKIIKLISHFVVDIRDFISRSNGNIHFSIPNYYWNYIKQRNEISTSNLSDDERKRELAMLDASNRNPQTEGLCYRFSIPEAEFITYLHYDSDFIPYGNTDTISNEKHEVTKEQRKEVQEFLDSILK